MVERRLQADISRPRICEEDSHSAIDEKARRHQPRKTANNTT